MRISAPYPAIVSITELPSPQFSDSRAIDASVNYRQALDATRYTYVKSSTGRKLLYEFTNMGRGKLAELQEFFKLYTGVRVLVEDHNSLKWSAIFDIDSITFSTVGRAANSGGQRFEQGTVTLEFIGEPIL